MFLPLNFSLSCLKIFTKVTRRHLENTCGYLSGFGWGYITSNICLYTFSFTRTRLEHIYNCLQHKKCLIEEVTQDPSMFGGLGKNNYLNRISG